MKIYILSLNNWYMNDMYYSSMEKAISKWEDIKEEALEYTYNDSIFGANMNYIKVSVLEIELDTNTRSRHIIFQEYTQKYIDDLELTVERNEGVNPGLVEMLETAKKHKRDESNQIKTRKGTQN